jgi:hypothetical protein
LVGSVHPPPPMPRWAAALQFVTRLPRLAVGPERTRISCHAALDMASCAAFRKESRMKFANATNLDRKSGVAQWRDLRFLVRLSGRLSIS